MTFSRTSLFMLYVEECLEVALPSLEVLLSGRSDAIYGTVGKASPLFHFCFCLRPKKHVNSLVQDNKANNLGVFTY